MLGLGSSLGDHTKDMADFVLDLRSSCYVEQINGVSFCMHSGKNKREWKYER